MQIKDNHQTEQETRTYIISLPVNFTGKPDLTHHERFEVSKEVYQAYYRPIWRTHDNAKRHGGCGCADWRKCDGDCFTCRYQTNRDLLSLDKMHDDAGDSVDDDSDPKADDFEDRVLEDIALGGIAKRIQELTPEERQICGHIIAGTNERDAAASMGLSKTTYHDRKTKLIARLRAEWSDLL